MNRQLLKLSAPLALGHLAQISLQVVDTYFIGKLGAEALSAASLGTGWVTTLGVFGVGILFGLDYPLAHSWGAKEDSRYQEWWQHGLLFAIFLSIPFLAGSFLLLPSALSLFEIPESIRLSTLQYSHILSWSILPWLVFTVLRQGLQAQGRASWAMVILIGMNILNWLGNEALTQGITLGSYPVPALGLKGSAYATLLSRWLGVLFLLLHPRVLSLVAAFKRFCFRPENFRGILRLGAPAGLQTLMEMGIFSLAAFLIGKMTPLLGPRAVETAIAAHHIALQYASILFMIPYGIGSAAAVLVAQNKGAGTPSVGLRLGTESLQLGILLMVLLGVVLFFFAESAMGVFTSSPAVIESGAHFLRVAAIFQIADSTQTIATGALRGWGETRPAMIANGVGHWLVGLPTTLLLGFAFGWGPRGVWYGLAGGLVTVAGILLYRWRRVLVANS